MAANYPTADPSFSAKTAGQKIQSAHVDALQDEVVAIGSALRGTLQHDVNLASGKVYKLNGTTVVSSQMTLLHASSGTDASAAATNVDSVAISGLTAKDTLLIYWTLVAVTQATTTPGVLYNDTDGVSVSNPAVVLAAGTTAQGTVTARQAQAGATKVVGHAVASTSAPNTYNVLTTANFTTNWTGNWTLALRHGGVTAGGTLQWTWAVYKVAGQ